MTQIDCFNWPHCRLHDTPHDSCTVTYLYVLYLINHYFLTGKFWMMTNINKKQPTFHPYVKKQTELTTHTCLTALCLGLPGSAGTRKVKLIWILLKQETVSGSGISWAICKSAPRSRQITTQAPHHSVFLQAGCKKTNWVQSHTIHIQLSVPCGRLSWLMSAFERTLK